MGVETRASLRAKPFNLPIPLPSPPRSSTMTRDANTSVITKRKRATACETEPEVPAAPAKNARRKVDTSTGKKTVDVVDLTGNEPEVGGSIVNPAKLAELKGSSKAKGKRQDDGDAPERRLRVFRKHAPKTYLEKLDRARTQRMFVLGHSVRWIDRHPIIDFDIVGTTGNIYKVTVGKVPFCSCPDSQKGNQCKHICYVLVNALKAPAHLQYQLAFLSTELNEIYQGSPISRVQAKPEDNTAGNRKPVEGDCPICFMEFEPDKEDIVWCKAACGNNIHKVCFDKWAATQRAQGVRCVYCRSNWQFDTENIDVEQLKKSGRVNDEGYVNVADQMGLSGIRDSSTYYQPWGYRGSYYYGQPGRRWY